jgi:RES domain-containing protein
MALRVSPAWRMAKHTAKYRADDLSGGGAKEVGGRWNSKGRAVLYAGSSIALSTLETLVHTTDRVNVRNMFLVRLDIPLAVWKLREVVDATSLPPTWVAEPAGSTTIELGDAWIDAVSSPLLFVPSVVVPEEHNILINPAHPASQKITAIVVRQFLYDPRL